MDQYGDTAYCDHGGAEGVVDLFGGAGVLVNGGKITDETELNQYGERIFNLQRGVLLREGWRPKADDVVEEFNYTDPVGTVFMNPDVIVPGPGKEVISRKGQTLDRAEFETMRKEFYDLRGWDAESGLQKAETLERLGLPDLVQNLTRIDRVAK